MAKKKKSASSKTGQKKQSPEERELAQLKSAAKTARRRAQDLEKTAAGAERRAGERAADLESMIEKHRRKLAKAEQGLRLASDVAEAAKQKAEQARAEADAATGRLRTPEAADFTPPLPSASSHDVDADASPYAHANEAQRDPGAASGPATSTSASGEVPDVQTIEPEALTPPLPHADSEDEPSEAWTVVRLRALARKRGVSGSANKNKAELIEALRG